MLFGPYGCWLPNYRMLLLHVFLVHRAFYSAAILIMSSLRAAQCQAVLGSRVHGRLQVTSSPNRSHPGSYPFLETMTKDFIVIHYSFVLMGLLCPRNNCFQKQIQSCTVHPLCLCCVTFHLALQSI